MKLFLARFFEKTPKQHTFRITMASIAHPSALLHQRDLLQQVPRPVLSQETIYFEFIAMFFVMLLRKLQSWRR
jgi:hypothetical protein